jgi:hypothetical protein
MAERFWVYQPETEMVEGRFPGAYNPVEFDKDGAVRIVVGLTLLTDLDGVIERGAERVWQVDDNFEHPELIYPERGSAS